MDNMFIVYRNDVRMDVRMRSEEEETERDGRGGRTDVSTIHYNDV